METIRTRGSRAFSAMIPVRRRRACPPSLSSSPLHLRPARISRPGLPLSIFGSHPRTTAESLTVHCSTASTSRERAASVGAPAASPPATDDTQVALRPPSDVACGPRCSVSSATSAAFRAPPRPVRPNWPKESTSRSSRKARRASISFTWSGRVTATEESAVALLELHRGLPSQAQTSQSPRITGADCSR